MYVSYKEVMIYYIIGVIVSLYHIWFYRFSRWKSPAKPFDAIGAIIGPWVWPVQIIVHFMDRIKK